VNRQIPLVTALLSAALAGCASPLHLQYDFGRAYTTAIISQADLTRPSVANSQYQLYGTEAESIRIRVREKTTDEEEGGIDYSQK
jgi:hypothetical protein